jgi:hypothetical protein
LGSPRTFQLELTFGAASAIIHNYEPYALVWK